MTIARTIRLAALIAALSVAVAALGCELFYLHWLRSIVAAGNRQLFETEPDALDRELRAALPPGTQQPTLEATLRSHHLQYVYHPEWHLIRATAPDLKGSNPLAETSLRIDFYLDSKGSLKRADSRILHSGL